MPFPFKTLESHDCTSQLDVPAWSPYSNKRDIDVTTYCLSLSFFMHTTLSPVMLLNQSLIYTLQTRCWFRPSRSSLPPYAVRLCLMSCFSFSIAPSTFSCLEAWSVDIVLKGCRQNSCQIGRKNITECRVIPLK